MSLQSQVQEKWQDKLVSSSINGNWSSSQFYTPAASVPQSLWGRAAGAQLEGTWQQRRLVEPPEQRSGSSGQLSLGQRHP